MRDAAGQLTDCLDLLRLAQRFLGPAQHLVGLPRSRNVAAEGEDLATVGGCRPGDPAIAAVLMAEPTYVGRQFADLRDRQSPLGRRNVIRMKEVDRRATDDFRFRIAELVDQAGFARW